MYIDGDIYNIIFLVISSLCLMYNVCRILFLCPIYVGITLCIVSYTTNTAGSSHTNPIQLLNFFFEGGGGPLFSFDNFLSVTFVNQNVDFSGFWRVGKRSKMSYRLILIYDTTCIQKPQF